MSHVSIPSEELKQLDRQIRDMERLINAQQKLIDLMHSALASAGVLPNHEPTPGPDMEITNLDQLIRSEK